MSKIENLAWVLPRPNTILMKRIFLETRMWHKLRCIHIHQKNSDAWKNKERSNNGTNSN